MKTGSDRLALTQRFGLRGGSWMAKMIVYGDRFRSIRMMLHRSGGFLVAIA